MNLKGKDTIAVVGGGPAGAFFAIHFLRLAKLRRLDTSLVIIEKKAGGQLGQPHPHFSCPESCNYCAGGLSPKLAEALEREELFLPDEIIAGRILSLTIHSDWKNIELRVPEGKKMYAVFRGSRPKGRDNKGSNFDAFLLEKAREAGAQIVSGEVYELRYSREGKPILRYNTQRTAENIGEGKGQAIEADFVVLAGGVNHSLGRAIDKNPFWDIVRKAVPGFVPPRVRKALICEVEIQKEMEALLEGEIYFIEYGSKTLKIEMSSLIPKKKYITAAMLGRSIDDLESSDNLALVREYLDLPQVRRILPFGAVTRPACICAPNMTVDASSKVIGNRAAIIGDLAWARLYKDGIYSAYLTAAALARAILERGIDARSLRATYVPAIRELSRDNGFGRILFMLNRFVFSSPVLSRILYQAVLTERKTNPARERRLADILWKIASGDDTYRASLQAMFHPLAVWSIFAGGFLLTMRNFLTEQFFGLRWHRLGRYPTGLHKEDMEEKRQEFLRVGRAGVVPRRPAFESMYSIRIKSEPDKILRHLGALGDRNRAYFKPRWLKVRRISGSPNQPGSLIGYITPFKFLDFKVTLETRVDDKILIYRVRDGFAAGGVFIFKIEKEKPGVHMLYVYVAFDIASGKKWVEKISWFLLKCFFPGFVHDVLWNHTLCQLKDIVEMDST
jgi:flavin-dependent dehydrogenase